MNYNVSGIVLLNFVIAFFSSCSSSEKTNKIKANILFIMADDLTYNEVGCFGGQNAKTTNIDKLADEGLLFNRAYVSMAMCTPSRVELYTGLYPMESGCAWNHSMTKPGTKSIFHYLTDLGYRVGISGKNILFLKRYFHI
jgi:N-sulfoglucosamine sulfohydrolase